MTQRFEDRVTGEQYDQADLDAQYCSYVDDLAAELPDTEPCSFQDWLRGELQDRLIPAGPASDPAPGASQQHQ
ncbi:MULTISPECIES: hypothetical protein [Mycolicibacterium]|uniref:hypothetical protein n=1 Tax=Mycolicibacterium TaxID=1866885 RepID=UPI00263502F8|nr:hypothetical protein [Mycolicibacterium fortuitum]